MNNKKLKEGDIFYVLYNKKYFFGRILIDITDRILKKENINMFKFAEGCYLLAVYQGIYDIPVLDTSTYIIPSIYTYKTLFYSKKNQIEWNLYNSEDIDYTQIDFPESLISIHGKGICFSKGELEIPTPITREEYDGKFNIKKTVISSYYSVLNYALYYQDRSDLLDFVPAVLLNRQDLRFAPEKRLEVYKAIGEDPGQTYYEMALKHGFDLARFYN